MDPHRPTAGPGEAICPVGVGRTTSKSTFCWEPGTGCLPNGLPGGRWWEVLSRRGAGGCPPGEDKDEGQRASRLLAGLAQPRAPNFSV